MSVASGIGGVSLFLHSKAAAHAVVAVVVLISQYFWSTRCKKSTRVRTMVCAMALGVNAIVRALHSNPTYHRLALAWR